MLDSSQRSTAIARVAAHGGPHPSKRRVLLVATDVGAVNLTLADPTDALEWLLD
jgi:hypothetical protein